MDKIATAIEQSSNAKIGGPGEVSATYAAQTSCPKSCAFYHNGCYAEIGNSFAGFTTHRLNQTANKRRSSHIAVAKAEAAAMNRLSARRPIRIHVVGDCRDDASAKIISAAAKRFPIAWTYTHAWREVKRKSWGKVAVLASCESLEDAKRANEKGYAALVVVDHHPADGKAWTDDSTGMKVIPCPENTRDGVTCNSCKLCWKDRWLRESKSVIAVRAHGTKVEKVKAALVQIGG